jgi:hypothetical protein
MSIEPEGQLSQNERLFLIDLVKRLKPVKILESGTWKGGGSTLCFAKGLFENQNGILDSYEEHEPFACIAKNYYSSSQYKFLVNIHNEDFLTGIKNLNNEYYEDLELVFLDGGDEKPDGYLKLEEHKYIEDYNLSENLQSFKYLAKKIKSGTIVLLHDWSTYNGRGNFVKRYLEDINFEDFDLIDLIEGSTGMAYLVKK